MYSSIQDCVSTERIDFLVRQSLSDEAVDSAVSPPMLRQATRLLLRTHFIVDYTHTQRSFYKHVRGRQRAYSFDG